MAIVKMSKLKLVGVNSHKEAILNALSHTDSVEIVATSELENTIVNGADKEIDALVAEHNDAERCIEFMLSVLDKNKKQPWLPKETTVVDGFFLSFDEFIRAENQREETHAVVDGILKTEERLMQNKAEASQTESLLDAVSPYLSLAKPFSFYANTARTVTHLGTIKTENILKLKTALNDYPLTSLCVGETNGDVTLIMLVAMNEEDQIVSAHLGEFGFSACPFNDDITANEKAELVKTRLKNLAEEEINSEKEICFMTDKLKEIKVYTDYLKFLIEKKRVAENFRTTQTTFVLESYVPTESVDKVKTAVEKVTDGAVFIEVSEPTEDDEPPTLLRNNAVVRPTEFITEMYSMPAYRELDPTKLVFFFFMLFMGVIMADVGYGFLMIVVGLFLARRIKVMSGAKRIWQIVAISGVPTMIFGALFNSYFGIALPYGAILPSPVPSGNGTADMMTILLLCLLLGVIHIGSGYLFKAINDFRRKNILAGIFDGMTWVVFFVGFIFAAFNFIVAYLMPTVSMDTPVFQFFGMMQMPGVYMAGGAVLVATLTAGRNEKGFGKFTKGFGAVYGIINLLSDILSYARLFGLLLSGMIIATTFNDMGLGLIAGGGVGYVLGGLVMVVGHVFNLAMNVLGAYIHDSRLQYIEFFSKFYEGEGRKFVPFGSEFDYVYLKKN